MLLLRITVPADIYSGGILIEVEGVEGQLLINSESCDDLPNTSKKARSGRREALAKDVRSYRARSTQPVVHDPGGTLYGLENIQKQDASEILETLPSTVDIAQSFLQTEPAQRRAELQAAISKSQYSSQSPSSEEGEEDDGAGFGTALSLPTFIADFLRGVGDRLRLEVRRVHLDVDMNIDASTGHSTSTIAPNPEKVTLRLSIEAIKVDNSVPERKPEHEKQRIDTDDTLSHGGGGRCVSIIDVRCMVLSDASFSNNVAQFSGPPSPIATHSIHRHTQSSKVSTDDYDSKSRASSSSACHDMSESIILNSTSKSDKNVLRPATSMALNDTSDRPEAKDDDVHELALRNTANLMHESQKDRRQYQGIQDDAAVNTSNANFANPLRQFEGANAVQMSGRRSNPPVGSESHNSERSYRTSITSLYHEYSSDEERKAINQSKAVQVSNENLYSKVPDRFVALAESISINTSDLNSSHSSEPSSDEDLTESKIFSHEEVESLYMSAISQVSTSNYQEDDMPATSSPSAAPTPVNFDRAVDPRQVPWQDSFENHDAAIKMPIFVSQENVSSTISIRPQSPSLRMSVELPTAVGAGSNESPQTASENGKSQSANSRSSQTSARVAKQFFHLDELTLIIPNDDIHGGPTGNARDIDADIRKSVRGHPRVPGAFSDYDISQASTVGVGSERSQVSAIDEIKDPHANSKSLAPISVFFHSVSLVGDMSLLRLVVMIAQHFSSLQSLVSNGGKHELKSQSASYAIALHIETLCWKFVDVVRGFAGDLSSPPPLSASSPANFTDPDTLLVVKLEEADVIYKLDGMLSSTDISVGKFEFGYTDNNIVEFDLGLRMRESTHDILVPSGKDVVVSILKTPESLRVSAITLPLHVTMDLARLDETLNWFGGLSTVLGLGSSMVSTVTVIEPKTKNLLSTARKRGVHFDSPGGDTPFAHALSVQRKITIRVGGVTLELYGKESALRLDSSALKLVSRDEGIGIQLDKLRFSGPYLRQHHETPTISIHLDNIRIEYLPKPREVDLARLLALLAPSRDRHDMDDDILLETLFRQRRQGAVLRFTVGNIEGDIARSNDLEHLLLISEELTKLSTVARYLPEVDRPGILSLILVRKVRLQVQVNSKFGSADVISQNIEVAHVTLPSLTLLGINSLCIHHRDVELIGAGLSLDPGSEQQIPMIMGKLVGDEMEPTVKIKLWNIRLEYYVSTLMTILGLSENANGEIIIADVVKSVFSLTDQHHPPKLASQSSQASEKSSSGTRLLRFEVTIRDSLIGLNPRLSKSKGLVVLSNATIFGAFPKIDDSELGGSLEIKKASLMVIDSIANIVKEKDLPDDPPQRSKRSQYQVLGAMGYVGVSDISAAKVTWQMVKGADGENSVDVEVRDELFVLETCADSTQTLQSVLSGLNPPMPPSQELKYRTEVVPVEDMLASFTGDAYSTGRGSERATDDLPLGLDEGDMMNDDVPQNLEFVSSFYNPDPTVMADDIANSILEGDFGTLAGPLVTRKIGDKRLLQSFQEQYEVAPASEPLSFDEEHFGSRSEVDGRPRKWSSDQNTYNLITDRKLRGSPLKIRVRDVHIIWNIFDGYDWQRTRDAIGQAVADVESKAAERLARKDKRKPLDSDEEEASVIGDFLFNSIYIGIPTNHDPRDLSRAVNRNLDDLISEAESYATSTTVQGSPNRQGQMPRTKRKRLRLQRSKHHKMAFELKGVSVDLVVFSPSSGETQSSIDIRVQDLEIFDHVPTSTWKKFATYMRDAGERESGSSMVHIEILNVRPIPELAASEIILKATVLPLRLHVDQDALDFMTRFFEFKDDSAPISTSKSEAVFFQRVEVNSIQVKLDFKPKRVDYAGIRSGHTTEFMNFFILDQADMVLRHVIIYGVAGFEKLGKTLNDIWMPDVKRNQLPGILAGLAPVRSLVNVGGGMKDLVIIPIREYRKDGRIIRSIQKGAFSFAKTTTTELAKLGAKLALGTQTVLQGAEDYLTQSTNPQRLDNWEGADLDEDEKKHISLYADQPIGVMQGLRGAYRHLERDLVMAKDAIIAMPAEVMESSTAGGAARAVLRTAPTVILRPALGVTKAVGQTFLGATNSLDKGERRRVEDVSIFLFFGPCIG